MSAEPDEPAGPDRQQQLRDRISVVEAQVRETSAAVQAATGASVSTAEKLEKQRAALRKAEQDHDRAVKHLQAIESDQRELQGELGTLSRRLDMASIVRKARA